MSARDTVAGLGTVLIAIVGIALSVAVGLVLLYGAAWASARLLPWFGLFAAIALVVEILILLPLAIPRKTRGFSSVAIFVLSYIFGASLWMLGLLLTLEIWGVGGVVIGIILGGIGVVPIAALATLISGMWTALIELVLLAVATYASRGGALWLAETLEV